MDAAGPEHLVGAGPLPRARRRGRHDRLRRGAHTGGRAGAGRAARRHHAGRPDALAGHAVAHRRRQLPIGLRAGRSSPVLPTFWPARIPNHVLREEDYAIVVDDDPSVEERRAAFAPATTGSASSPPPTPDTLDNMMQGWWKLGMVQARPGPGRRVPAVLKVEADVGFERRAGDHVRAHLPPAGPGHARRWAGAVSRVRHRRRRGHRRRARRRRRRGHPARSRRERRGRSTGPGRGTRCRAAARARRRAPTGSSATSSAPHGFDEPRPRAVARQPVRMGRRRPRCSPTSCSTRSAPAGTSTGRRSTPGCRVGARQRGADGPRHDLVRRRRARPRSVDARSRRWPPPRRGPRCATRRAAAPSSPARTVDASCTPTASSRWRATRPRSIGDDDHTSTVEAVADGWWYTAPCPDGEPVRSVTSPSPICSTAACTTRAGFTERVAATRHVAGTQLVHGPTAPFVVPAGTAQLVPPTGPGGLPRVMRPPPSTLCRPGHPLPRCSVVANAGDLVARSDLRLPPTRWTAGGA